MGVKDWDYSAELWEHQGRPLTVADLIAALRQCDGALPVNASLVGGVETGRTVPIAEMGLTGVGESPEALVITVNCSV